MNHLKLLAYPLVLGAFLITADLASAKTTHPWGAGVTVSIGADGTALVRGAEVTSVGDGGFTAETAWGSHELSWEVDTESDTNYVGASGEAISRSDIETGDTISFSGALQGSLTVIADTVRLWTDDAKRASIAGVVTDKDQGSFVVEWNKRSVTVDLTGDTEFSIRGNDDANYEDLEEGDRVKVTGTFSADEDELTASAVVIGEIHDNNGKRPWDSWGEFWNKLKVRFEHR